MEKSVIFLVAMAALGIGAGIGAALGNGTRLPIDAFAKILCVIALWTLLNGLAEYVFERLRPNDVSWKGRFIASMFAGLMGFGFGVIV